MEKSSKFLVGENLEDFLGFCKGFNLPELTEESIKRIAAISDEAIDYSDIPPFGR